MLEAALILGAYLVGAIPVGVLVARSRGVNLFEVGSGNVGATNVKRALGSKAALLVFVLDVLKGVLPSAAALQLLHSAEWAFGIGLAAVAGHCLSPFLRFRGGKGVATGLGVLFGSVPLVAVCALGLFLLVFAATRWVSLSSIIAAASVLVFGLVFEGSPLILGFSSLMAAFLIYRHIPNIKRILDGTEPKFSLGRDKPAPSEPNPDEPESEVESPSLTHSGGRRD